MNTLHYFAHPFSDLNHSTLCGIENALDRGDAVAFYGHPPALDSGEVLCDACVLLAFVDETKRVTYSTYSQIRSEERALEAEQCQLREEEAELAGLQWARNEFQEED